MDDLRQSRPRFLLPISVSSPIETSVTHFHLPRKSRGSTGGMFWFVLVVVLVPFLEFIIYFLWLRSGRLPFEKDMCGYVLYCVDVDHLVFTRLEIYFE